MSDNKALNFITRITYIKLDNGSVIKNLEDLNVRIIPYVALGYKKESYQVYLGDKKLCKTTSDKILLKYNCCTCGRENKLHSYRTLQLKISSKNIDTCKHCYQALNEKLKIYRRKLMTGKIRRKNKPTNPSPIEIYNNFSEKDKSRWESHNFKSEAEWKKYSKHFIKVNGISIENVTFKLYAYSNNATKISNKILYNNKEYSIKEITCKCSKCKKIYKIRPTPICIKKRKGFFCRKCADNDFFYNATFTSKKTLNNKNESIIYQSKFEYSFINFCNSHNIEIQNGPIVEYTWNKNIHNYYVDFYIPKLNWLIELKDYHIWHKKELKNGKWKSKERGVNILIENGKYAHYELLYYKKFNSNWKSKFLKLYNSVDPDLKIK